jgi:hypothetical protein
MKHPQCMMVYHVPITETNARAMESSSSPTPAAPDHTSQEARPEPKPVAIKSTKVWRGWRLTLVSADRLWAHDEGGGKVVEEFFSVVRVLDNDRRSGWRVACGRHLLYLIR